MFNACACCVIGRSVIINIFSDENSFVFLRAMHHHEGRGRSKLVGDHGCQEMDHWCQCGLVPMQMAFLVSVPLAAVPDVGVDTVRLLKSVVLLHSILNNTAKSLLTRANCLPASSAIYYIRAVQLGIWWLQLLVSPIRAHHQHQLHQLEILLMVLHHHHHPARRLLQFRRSNPTLLAAPANYTSSSFTDTQSSYYPYADVDFVQSIIARCYSVRDAQCRLYDSNSVLFWICVRRASWQAAHCRW